MAETEHQKTDWVVIGVCWFALWTALAAWMGFALSLALSVRELVRGL